jgi:uncharacterized phage-associated protein
MYNIDYLARIMLSYGSVSHKKLQKLIYYLYSWYLTIFESRISNAHFEAWAHGPVSPELYQIYKFYGWSNIPCTNSPIQEDSQLYRLTSLIMQYYGQLSADELENLTHNEDPWQMARVGCSKYEVSSNKITDANIIDYYRSSELYEEFLSELQLN